MPKLRQSIKRLHRYQVPGPSEVQIQDHIKEIR